MEIIRDLLWLWILGAVGGTGYILWALFVRDSAPTPAKPQQQITTRRTPSAPPPVARPAGTGLPTRTPVPPIGGPPGEHQRRGSAPTVKLAAAEPGERKTSSPDDQAASDLFAGLSAAKAKADAAQPVQIPAAPQLPVPKDSVEKAQRLEERGFHVGAAKNTEPAPAADKPAADLAGQPRTQTQELDDILKRIDAVLSESGASASEATLTGGQQPGGQQTMPVSQPPPTEKLERKATDPNQQKLF